MSDNSPTKQEDIQSPPHESPDKSLNPDHMISNYDQQIVASPGSNAPQTVTQANGMYAPPRYPPYAGGYQSYYAQNPAPYYGQIGSYPPTSQPPQSPYYSQSRAFPPGQQSQYQNLKTDQPQRNQFNSTAPQQADSSIPSFQQGIPRVAPQIYQVPNSEICGYCEKPAGGTFVRCISACKKFYHRECVDKMSIKTLHPSDGVHPTSVQCENCLARVQRCQHCQTMGQIGNSMQKCAVQSCNYFFHKACMEKESQSLPSRIKQHLQSPVFICGAHHCQNCVQPLKTDEKIIRCLKCVASYHEQCRDPQKVQPITLRTFVCLTHDFSEMKEKFQIYVDSKGNQIPPSRLGKNPQQITEEGQENAEAELNSSQKEYQRMKTGLLKSIGTEELLATQRHDHIAQQQRNGAPHHPLNWRKLDPSETIVLNQTTIQKVNEIIQKEIAKASGDKSLQQLEKQWKADLDTQHAGKTIRRVQKIIHKCQRSDKILDKQRQIMEEKFQKYVKFFKGDVVKS